ncbi:MAG: DUF72 domain-containing protein [Calditrichaeota bacterium]|nr:DUF72 domain-containing protein [Calditrichota bacterium]
MKVGCCGFPEARTLYYRHYSVVEIQQTFYQLPRSETASKWRRDAPENFEFNMKVWQVITHEASSPTYRRMRAPVDFMHKEDYGFFKPSRVVFRAWEETKKIARAMQARALIFQCPGSFTPSETNIKNMRKFFKSINRESFKFVWEPRGNWEPSLIRELCEELDLIHGNDPFKSPHIAGEFFYLRLHGKMNYRYQYPDEDLQKLLEQILALNKPGYVMFNNSNMKSDSMRFMKLLAEAEKANPVTAAK